MKIVVCTDSFKGSLSAREATDTIAVALREKYPELEIISIPLADGGEGTSEVVRTFYPLKIVRETFNPLGHTMKGSYHTDISGKKAFIESATVIGLPLLTTAERNPMKASSYGLGVLIADAVRDGVEEVFVSLGGSATCDGGMGMLEALGYRFFDDTDTPIPGNGANLIKINRIDDSGVAERLREVKFTAVCDVRNPLLGERGAARVFAPQKGASEEEVEILERSLRAFMSLGVGESEGLKAGEKEGAGAAGGLGFAMYAFLGADYMSGIDFILDAVDFDEKIKGADLIITGEGKIDMQSLMGKVVSGVLSASLNRGNLREVKENRIPVVAIGGMVEDKDELLKAGLDDVYSISDPALSLEENMSPSQTKANLKKIIMGLKFSNLC